MGDRTREQSDQAVRPALVAGASTAMGLAIARGLRGTGATIIGATVERGAPTCRSRLWHHILEVSAPNPHEWLETLYAAHARYGRMVLFPADDPAVRIVAEHAAELATMYDFVLPELATVERLLEKTSFHQWALAHGFPVPHTVIVGNSTELRAALRDATFPVAMKPFERTLKWQTTSGRDTVYRLESASDLDRIPFDPFDVVDRYVVQEWIPGKDSDVYFCLTYRDRDGRELASQGGRKIAQWPVDVGSTALAVTHPDSELHKLTQRLLDAAGHVGFGSVEVRLSERDGRMLITEPTVGRPDLQTGLAAAARTNLVDLAYRDAVGLPQPPSQPSREAIWVHETAFPMSVVVGARHRRLDGRTLIATLARLSRRPTGALFSPRDPLPLLAQFARLAGKALRAAGSVARRS